MRPEPSDPIVEGLFALDAIFPGKFQTFKGSLETLLKQEQIPAGAFHDLHGIVLLPGKKARQERKFLSATDTFHHAYGEYLPLPAHHRRLPRILAKTA